mgnify:CR=1 FL=1
MFTRLFVQNPIFTNVIATIAVILGIVSLTRLPIALYPDITPPTIAVSASYPGASAQVIAETVGAELGKRQKIVEIFPLRKRAQTLEPHRVGKMMDGQQRPDAELTHIFELCAVIRDC